MTEKDFTEALEKEVKLMYDDTRTYKPLTPEMIKELAKELWGIDIDEQG